MALGSGAARGWAHVGVLDALRDQGIEPDVVCGASMGAVVGAAYVADRLDGLAAWAAAATWRDVVALLDVRFLGGGLVDGTKIRNFFADLGVDGAIEGYAKPFAAIASDLTTGAEVWLQRGPIHEAVRASISLPGIFTPVQVDGRWLVDGGLVNPVPVSACRALGAEVVIAVNLTGDLLGRRFLQETDDAESGARAEFIGRILSQVPAPLRAQTSALAQRLLHPGPAKPGYFDVVANAINIMQVQIASIRLAESPPDVILTPVLRDIGLLQFDRAALAIAEGRACVERAAASLQPYV